jgi:hypothetical protein
VKSVANFTDVSHFPHDVAGLLVVVSRTFVVEVFGVRSNQRRARAMACIVCGMAAFTVHGGAQGRPDLAGVWTLNRDLSEFPSEVGFDPNWGDSASGNNQGGPARSGSGGRGGGDRGRGTGGGAPRLPAAASHFQSEEDVKKMREIVQEVREPAAQITISRTSTTVSIADPRGRTRLFDTSGKEDIIQLDAGPISAVTKWDGAELLVRYHVDKDQDLVYRYGRIPGSDRLRVRVQFSDHGRGAVITRVYDPVPAS